MKQASVFIFLIFLINVAVGQTNKREGSYLDQAPPGLTPQVFAAGLISTDDEYEFGSVFNKKANLFYYAVRLDEDWNAEIRYTKLINGRWSNPRRFPLDDTYSYNDPFFTRDENRLYFMSNRADDGNSPSKDSDLWFVQKKDSGWSKPVNLGGPVNSDKNEYYISIAGNGTIYYASNVHTTEANESDHDIYAATHENGRYQSPTRLDDAINSEYFEVDAYVHPDESYLIFCSTRPGGYGEGDLYISFRNEDDTWSEAVNMGAAINTEHHEFCPFVSRDGNYFFYTSNGDIYWVDAAVIDRLRNN